MKKGKRKENTETRKRTIESSQHAQQPKEICNCFVNKRGNKKFTKLRCNWLHLRCSFLTTIAQAYKKHSI
jgi:hypothetical protein